MIDAKYFEDQLSLDAAPAGTHAVVEVRVRSGQYHRVHAVVAVHPGYVILERYEPKSEEGLGTDAWHQQVLNGTGKGPYERAIVPFESILDIVISTGGPGAAARIGFGA